MISRGFLATGDAQRERYRFESTMSEIANLGVGLQRRHAIGVNTCIAARRAHFACIRRHRSYQENFRRHPANRLGASHTHSSTMQPILRRIPSSQTAELPAKLASFRQDNQLAEIAALVYAPFAGVTHARHSLSIRICRHSVAEAAVFRP